MPRRTATAAAAARDEADDVDVPLEGEEESGDEEAAAEFADQLEEEMNEGAAPLGTFKLAGLGCKLDEKPSVMLRLGSVAELLGVADYVRNTIGENATEQDVLLHNLQEMIDVVHTHVRRFPDGAKVKRPDVALWMMHMVRAGVYKKSPAAWPAAKRSTRSTPATST